MVMNVRNVSLFDVFVVFFFPCPCTTTIDVEHLFEQLNNRNVSIKLFSHSGVRKTKDVHNQLQFNINCSSFVISVELRGFITSPSINYTVF